VLAFMAGMINAVGFAGALHQGITHLTGTTTLLGVAAGELDARGALHFGAMIASYLAGAVASGAIVQDSVLRLGRRYGVVLVIESAMLAVAAWRLGTGDFSGLYLASAACGLQNAMASTYSGAVLRTTHVSGTLTDLGIFLGHSLRGVAVDPRRVRLLLTLVLSFLAGAVAGTRLFHGVGYGALYVPAATTGAIGLVYGIHTHLRRRAHA
jgi:uncharacterized membrane protein YoaK (UPF0700 family)